MKILVTGGAGFIGSHVAEAFLERGHSVDILDNLSTGLEENVPKNTGFYKQNIGDPEVERILRKRYDVICHYAAQIDLRKSLLDPIGDLRDDVLGAAQLFRRAVQNDIKQIVFASSGGAIYGEQKIFPAGEDHPIDPDSPYGLHKWIIEKYLRYYHKTAGLIYSSLRYANIYGPRQNSSAEAGVVAIFSTKLLKGEETVINGSGEQTRDFVFVADAVNSAVLSVEKNFCGEVNIGTAQETTIKTIFNAIRDAAGSDQPEKHGPPKEGEQFRSVLSYEKAGNELGWSPSVSIEEGLKTTVDYFKTLQPLKQ